MSRVLASLFTALPPLLCACRASGAPLTASWGGPHDPPVVRAESAPPLASKALLDLADGSEGSAATRPNADLERLAVAIGPLADDEGYWWPHLSLSLGGQLLATVNTQLRVDSALGNGTDIDMEDDFNVDESLFAGRIDATWRMGKRHELDFSVYDLRRSGTKVIDRDIQIGDVVFPVNTSVTSEFETVVTKLAYRYSFLYRERWHMGASFGVHWMDWSTTWKAGGAALEQDFDVTAPLPVIGLFGSYAITPKLYLNASSELFGLEYEQFDGFLNNTRLSLEHRTFAHLGFGLGFDYFLVNAGVESEDGRLDAEAEHDYFGLLGFVRIY